MLMCLIGQVDVVQLAQRGGRAQLEWQAQVCVAHVGNNWDLWSSGPFSQGKKLLVLNCGDHSQAMESTWCFLFQKRNVLQISWTEFLGRARRSRDGLMESRLCCHHWRAGPRLVSLVGAGQPRGGSHDGRGRLVFTLSQCTLVFSCWMEDLEFLSAAVLKRFWTFQRQKSGRKSGNKSLTKCFIGNKIFHKKTPVLHKGRDR